VAVGGFAREQRGRVWKTSEAVEEKAANEGRQQCELLMENGDGLARTAAEGTTLMQVDHCPRGGRGGGYSAASSEGEAAKRRQRPGATSSEKPRCNQARRAPFTHAEVGAGATRRGFDTQRKTGGGGRPALMASQQVERAAELQDTEVRAELDWCVRECERERRTGDATRCGGPAGGP
jgi:hypothetical protein